VRFEEELNLVLPADLPHRAMVITQCARHLEMIVEANQQFNLTRITSPREAAIKHVLDSVLPWRHFAAVKRVLDAGTGAGIPGVPLAIVLPETHFTLSDSIGKKARFVDSVVEALGITNIAVSNQRAEECLRHQKTDIITGRALTPLDKACVLFGPAIRSGTRAILYKGPDVDLEIAIAASAALKQRLHLKVLDRYELPDGLGARTLVEITA
jgi:16S rRNA (guanine527-N7)-methyltransferase